MGSALSRWLWKDCFEPELTRIPVDFGGQEKEAENDLFEVSLNCFKSLYREVRMLEEKLNQAKTVRPTAGKGRFEKDELMEHIKLMLPALDGLDRIIEAGEQSSDMDEKFQNFLESVRALRTRMSKIMEKAGLMPISSVGTEVNLDVHDVVATVPAGEYPANTVVTERLKGYYFKGKVLRDAKVVVAQ